VNVPVVHVALTGAWQVDDDRSIVINEERRPYLLHLRLLQEWLLCGRLGSGGPSGAVVTPGNTVTAETAFGGMPDAGIAAEYSRADHTHGTPPPPPIPPSLTAADTVVAETAPGQASAAGVALEYSRADHTHGTPPLPSIPTPANTVVSETAFGLAANGGGAATYSRSDHTHGTPPLPSIPTPANTVVQERTFGQAATAGTALTFSRSDHTHGTPPAPAVAGNFVEHPAGLARYAIVAAGIVRANGTGRPPVYNGLNARAVGPGQILVRFTGYQEPTSFQYIVKVLLVSNEALRIPSVTFDSFTTDGFLLRVTDNGTPVTPNTLPRVELMIEVSRFPLES
jgi:hypothetical protein